MEEMNIKKVEFSDRVFMLSALLILAIIASIIGGIIYNFQSLPQNAPQDITVSGSGKAYIKPDIAVVNLGVKTEAIKSQDAVNQNNTKMNAITKAIKDLGVEDKDIQTTSYNLSPIYDWTDRGGRIFKGYSLDQQITVKIRNFEKINDILDGATTTGANAVGDLQFTVDDMTKINAEARVKAIANAKQKAEAIASESGLQLGKLVNVSEDYNNYPQPIYGAMANAISMDKASVAPSVQAGQMEVNVSVNLTYKVK